VLQRVSKLPYKPDEADEFERAWLALADIHIAGGKFDLAQVRRQVCPAFCTPPIMMRVNDPLPA
jgi:hypothetical protein